MSASYKIERLQKTCFLNKENSDKSFNRWLKIFNSFPEGVAMIREDGNIEYSNKSLSKLLDLDTFAGQGEDKDESSLFAHIAKKPDNLTIKNMLEQTKIKKWSVDSTSQVKSPTSSVWDFIAKNEEGATFELKGAT